MIDFTIVSLIIAIVIVFLSILAITKSSEHYDTYYNMDNTVADVLGSRDYTDATLFAKYNWNVRDKYGNNLQDKVFDSIVSAKQLGTDASSLDIYPLSNYDSKFMVGKDMSLYNTTDMSEPQQTVQFRGQKMQLSQRLNF